MIKLRVEWRHDCPSCGTQLVMDFLDEAGVACLCPWCGLDETSLSCIDDDTRNYVLTAVGDIERAVNNRTLVPN